MARRIVMVSVTVVLGCLATAGVAAADTPGWECVPTTAGQAVVSGGTGAAPSCAGSTTAVLAPTYIASGVGGKRTVQFSAVNLQVVSGSGSTTATVNGEGNVVIGYAEAGGTVRRTGSHNLILGTGQGYTSYGSILAGLSNSSLSHDQLLAGFANTASAPEANVTGGSGNKANGAFSSITGGQSNQATGQYALVGGGFANTASGATSSVTGGRGNETTGGDASISGGCGNTAGRVPRTAPLPSTSDCNFASDAFESISGGMLNSATGGDSSVTGGESNLASGEASSVLGGSHQTSNTIDGHFP